MLDEVAARFADIFRSHSDGTAETAARVLLLANAWAASIQWAPTSLGQRALAAMGHSPAWAQQQAIDTAVLLWTATGPAPMQVPIGYTSIKTGFWGATKYRFHQLATIRGWFIPFMYDDGDGERRRAVLIGPRGAFSMVIPARDGSFAVEAAGQEAADQLVATVLAEPTPSSWVGSESEQAIPALVR